MRLTNVLYLTDAQGRSLRYRNRGKLRVTHIIDGIQQYAGISYKDKNFTVVVGDSIAGGEVIWIDPTEVVITKGDKEFHYPVAGLTIEKDMTTNDGEKSLSPYMLRMVIYLVSYLYWRRKADITL